MYIKRLFIVPETCDDWIRNRVSCKFVLRKIHCISSWKVRKFLDFAVTLFNARPRTADRVYSSRSRGGRVRLQSNYFYTTVARCSWAIIAHHLVVSITSCGRDTDVFFKKKKKTISVGDWTYTRYGYGNAMEFFEKTVRGRWAMYGFRKKK